MPMTDAPNFGTKFGRRKLCLRYIGPLLGTTSVAPVGRGDLTPPSQIPSRNLAGGSHTPGAPAASLLQPPVGGGLRPAPLGKASVLRQFPLVPEHHPISRRGGPMCPPGHAFLRDPPTGRHAGRPLQILLQSSSTPKNRAGTETRPYSRRMPNAGSRSTGPSPPSSPANQNTWNDRRHQSLHLPSPVPTSPASAQRSARPFELPRTLRDSFQRKGRSPSFGRFKEGLGGKFEIPPRIFLGKREGIFF